MGQTHGNMEMDKWISDTLHLPILINYTHTYWVQSQVLIHASETKRIAFIQQTTTQRWTVSITTKNYSRMSNFHLVDMTQQQTISIEKKFKEEAKWLRFASFKIAI